VALFFGLLAVGTGPTFFTTSAFFPTTNVSIPDFVDRLVLFRGGSSCSFTDDRPRFTVWTTFFAAIAAQGFRFFATTAIAWDFVVGFFAPIRVFGTKAFESSATDILSIPFTAERNDRRLSGALILSAVFFFAWTPTADLYAVASNFEAGSRFSLVAGSCPSVVDFRLDTSAWGK
jgi:hypothetical protein